MDYENTVVATAQVDQTSVDQAVSKMEHLVALLTEARSLAGELASMEITLSMNVE